MKKILMIICTSLLFAACGNQNNAGVQNEPPAGSTPDDTQAVAQPDSVYNMRDSVPNQMYDTGQKNPNGDTSDGSRGQ
jgi:hypothetical protein